MEAGVEKLTGLLRPVVMPRICVDYGGSDGTRRTRAPSMLPNEGKTKPKVH